MKKRSMRNALNEIAAVAALAAALSASPSAWGLSLGRLSVQSALGETLRAEIDVTSLTPEEASNLRVRVAPPESYRVAGIDYNAVLPATAVTLQRRADGTAFLRIVSDRSVQEPFVDLILELSWSSGRLLREYTLLFDPPSSKSAPSTAPVAAAPAPAPTPQPVAPPPVAVVPPPPPVATAPAPADVGSSPAPTARRPGRPEAPEAPVPGPRTTASGEGAQTPGASDYTVRKGDTLSGIASSRAASGVSLEQMLVSLYRGNSQAFIGNNMNRLKAGVVLTVPSSEQAAAVDQAEARQVIQAQSADFNAYRQRLAGAVPAAAEKAPTRKSAGKVQTEVQDRKEAAAPSPDRLTLDKGDKGKSASSAAEDKLAKERADKEAAARVKELARNLDELKKLQAASAASPAATGSATAGGPGLKVPSVAAAPAPASAPSSPTLVAPASAPAMATSPASAVVAAASAAPETVASAPEMPASMAPVTAAASEPAPASAPVTAAASAPITPMPPAEPQEPSFIDTLSDNPLVLPGAGIVLALLLGFGWYRLRNRNKDEAGVTSFLESKLQPDSFFGASGGQRVDTRDAAGTPSSMSYSLSQIDAIGDVDPVAEADVYLAYGRDLQAEEILKEAMRANPERLAIRTKLLEVYAKRRDAKGFELLAGELYGLTNGTGEDWSKAQEMGRSIDPDNPLYEPGGMPTGGHLSDSAMEPLGASTMPQSVVPSPSRFVDSGEMHLGDEPVPSGSTDLDLDISVPGPMDEAPPVSSAPGMFSLSQPSAFVPSQPGTALSQLDTGSRSLDFELQDMPPASSPSSAAVPSVDLGDQSLDLDGARPLALTTGSGDLSSAPLDLQLDDDGADPLARKVELAEEFRQIGDLEGARDLLQEVIEKADGALKSKAQGMLDNLS